jgi:predicted transcriptional regulator
MQRKNRCYHDIICSVLTHASEPAEVTELFWKAKLSGIIYSNLKAALLKAGLLELQDKKLHTTQKGQTWLQVYRSLKQLTEAEP